MKFGTPLTQTAMSMTMNRSQWKLDWTRSSSLLKVDDLEWKPEVKFHIMTYVRFHKPGAVITRPWTEHVSGAENGADRKSGGAERSVERAWQKTMERERERSRSQPAPT